MTRTDELRLRLLGTGPTDRLWGWLGPGLIALVGGVLRFWNLDRPHALVFDETYYVKQAYSLLRFGVEMRVLDSLKKPDDAFVGGNPNVFSTIDGDMVVHPPVGKWVIAAGEWLFGVRLGVGLAVLGRAGRHAVDPRRGPGRPGGCSGRRRSGCVAAFLLAFEGSHFVMSRTGILDIIVIVLRAVRVRGAARRPRPEPRDPRREGRGPARAAAWPEGVGPWLGWRPWRWVAGLSLGLCTGTKWSGLFFLAAFGLMSVWWDMGARRAAGVRRWGRGAPAQGRAVRRARDGGHRRGRLRRCRGRAGSSPRSATTGSGTPSTPARGRSGCRRCCATGGSTTRTRTSSTPRSRRRTRTSRTRGRGSCRPGRRRSTTRARPGAWPAAPSSSARRRSTRSARSRCGGSASSPCSSCCGGGWCGATGGPGAIAAGFIGGYLPWFVFQDRTIYTFYAVAFEPWVVLAVVFAHRAVGGPARGRPRALAAPVVRRRAATCCSPWRCSRSSTPSTSPTRSRTSSGAGGCGSPAGSDAGCRVARSVTGRGARGGVGGRG